MKKMAHVIVAGLQWGDEGKGRIVDLLTRFYDLVIRFQGSSNAAHTVIDDDGKKHITRLVPSGILSGTPAAIGGGVAVGVFKLLEEIGRHRANGIKITPANLLIAETAPVVLPWHAELDALREEASGAAKIGTTKSGVGPAYEDHVARRGIRMADLADEAYLRGRLERLAAHHNVLRRALGAPDCDTVGVFASLREAAPAILPHVVPLWRILHEMDEHGKRFLLEGAQGAMLDCDYGTYPYVTSSNTLAGQAAIGSGSAAVGSAEVLGVVKAYTTRVGGGPFPTELHDGIGNRMRERGGEFGTATGRPRRCGWFDAVAVRQAAMLSGATALAITKLDVLDGLPELKICVGYRDGAKSYDYLPASPGIQATCEPVYALAPGWEDATRGASRLEQLPAAAIAYLRRIERFVGVPVILASASPRRSEAIVAQDHEILHGRVIGCASRGGSALVGA